METASDQNRALILQRKTLVSNKEQVQKELEKLLNRTELLETDKVNILKDKKEEIARLKEEAEVTVKGLKEENQRSCEAQEQLENERDVLVEERNNLREQLHAKTQEFV